MSPTPDDPTQAQAWITGEAPDQTVDFYIPRGNTGPVGPRGPIGPSLAVGNVTTVVGPAAPGTIGPQGPTGAKGDPGGLTAGTPLASNNLNNIIADGVYVQQDGSLPSLALNYPGTGTLPGVMYVHKRTPSSIFQSFHARSYVSNTNMTSIIYERWSNDTGVSWSVWKAIAPQRVDQSAGRVIYTWDDVNQREQMIYGDTGRRNISSLIPTAVSGQVLLARQNNTVMLILADFLDSSPNTNVNWNGLLPVGFRPQNWIYMPIPSSRTMTIQNGGNVTCVSGGLTPNTTVYQGCLTWRTEEAWPTSLPGTAVGTIPL